MTPESVGLICCGGLMTIILLIISYFYYLEEKRICKHRWKEVNRTYWNNGFGGEFIKVELCCQKCGEVKWRNSS